VRRHKAIVNHHKRLVREAAAERDRLVAWLKEHGIDVVQAKG
jgi:hypothetical protein